MSEYSFFRTAGHSRLMALVRSVCHTLDEFLEGDELLPREIEVEQLLQLVYDERIPYVVRDTLMGKLDDLYDLHRIWFSSQQRKRYWDVQGKYVFTPKNQAV